MAVVDSAKLKTQTRRTEALPRCLVVPTSHRPRPLAPGVLRKVAWPVPCKMLSTSGNRESAEVVRGILKPEQLMTLTNDLGR